MENNMVRPSREKVERGAVYIQFVLTVLLTVCGAVLMFEWRTAVALQQKMSGQIGELEKFQAATSANRFTSEDGQRVWEAIGDLKAAIAAMPQEVPPPYFEAQVSTISTKLDKVIDTTTRLEMEVAGLKKYLEE